MPKISRATKHYQKMNKNQRLGSKVWDNIIKDITLRMSHQLIPLLNEAFHKNYPSNTKITLLKDKFPITRTNEVSINNNFRYTDILLLINDTDLFHLECQMSNDSNMSVRMVEYDFNVALRNGIKKTDNDKMQIHFPNSTVLYPEWNNAIPQILSCAIVFPDGFVYEYKINTIRIQDYSLEEIAKKHLNIFLPFQLLQFKKKLTTKENRVTKYELKELVKEIIIILDNELSQGLINTDEHTNYITYINQAAKSIFNKRTDLSKEVAHMTMPTIITPMSVMEEFREEMAETKAELAEAQAQITEKDSKLAEKDSKLAEKDSKLAEKDEQIQKLIRLLEINKISID